MGEKLRINSYPFNSKRYVLDIVSGLVHDLDNYCSSCWLLLTDPCELVTINDDELEEIKQHEMYKDDCRYCMKK